MRILFRGDALEKSMSRYPIEQIVSMGNIRTMFRGKVVAVQRLRLAPVSRGTRLYDERHRSARVGRSVVVRWREPQTTWLPLGIARDQRGFVLTGSEMRTPDVWTLGRDRYLLATGVRDICACGDVRLRPATCVAAAVREGSMAIAIMHQYLPVWLNSPAPATAGIGIRRRAPGVWEASKH